jgi:hypothetical protein
MSTDNEIERMIFTDFSGIRSNKNNENNEDFKKISANEFIKQIKTFLRSYQETNNIDLKYINFVSMFEFIIKHKYVLNYYQFSSYKFHDSMFNKLLESMNTSYHIKKTQRLDKLRQIKHELFPYSKLDDEDKIIKILSDYISINGLVSIIILYLEPTTYKPTITTLMNILKKMDPNKELSDMNMSKIIDLV